MILRKFPYIAIFVLLIALSHSEKSEQYDTNDWIPISQPRADVKKEDQEIPVEEKKATGRVLNLGDPPESNFFPDDNKQPRNYQQFLRETTNLNAFPKRPHNRHKATQHPYRFEGAAPPIHPGRQRVVQQPKAEASQQFYIPQPNPSRIPPPPPQYFNSPHEYHTIPEEYLAQQGLGQPSNLPYFQNYPNIPNIPDLPPIRLNASLEQIQAINHQLIEKRPKTKPNKQIELTTETPKEKENVQLLYVPLESLSQKHQASDLPRLHAYQQAPVPEIQQQFNYRPTQNKQTKIQDIQNDFIKQALEAHKLQQQFQQQPQYQPQQFIQQTQPQQFIQQTQPQQFQQQPQPQIQYQQQSIQLQSQQLQLQQPQIQQQDFHSIQNTQPYALPLIEEVIPKTTTTTTKRPSTKKRKPHQPPLAVYMGGDKNAGIADVLTILKDAKSIDVQDSVGPNSPKIFVGPSSLDPPEGYAKFDLPYLSSLDNNRVERKVDQFPFFVAPLSYKTPPGYSKIPLPSPHVGSVVVSTKDKIRLKETALYNQPDLPDDVQQYQINQQEIYTVRPPSSTPKYSKPEDHVINQFELDQINGFIPQYYVQQPPNQHLPEKYLFDNFPTAEGPQSYLQNIPKQQTKNNEYLPKHQKEQKNEDIKHDHKSSTPLTSQEQYIQEVIPDDKTTYDSIQQTRNTHPNTHSSTAIPPEQYHKEVTSKYNYEDVVLQNQPTYSKTRSRTTTPKYQDERDPYEALQHTRTPSRRARPSTTTTEIPQEQYFKEITHTRPRSSTQKPRQQYEQQIYQTTPTYEEEIIRTTSAPRQKYIQEEQLQITPPRSSPTSFPQNQYFDVSSPSHRTPTESFYSSRPTQNTFPEPNSKDQIKYTVLEEFEAKQPENPKQQPVYTPSSTPSAIQNYHTLNQETLDSKVLGQNQHEGVNYITDAQQIFAQLGLNQQYEEDEIREKVKTQNANVENFNLHPQLRPTNQVLPSLINNLEDQSVRQLLQPGLVRQPTKSPDTSHYEVESPRSTHLPKISSTTTTTTTTTAAPTTHLPVIETTTKRTRGRQRGNRYTTTTPSSVHSTRKTVQRGRRPTATPTRSRYHEDSTTEYTSARTTTDPTKKIITARSRFRTRGRPTQADSPVTDRVSSTERHYYEEITPLHVSTSRISDEPQHVTQKVQGLEQQYVVKTYPSIYNIPEEEKLAYDVQNDEVQVSPPTSTERINIYNIPSERVLISSPKSTVYDVQPEYIVPANHRVQNVEINRPSNEQNHQISYSTRQYEDNNESTTSRNTRLRPRVRSKPRTTTTQAPRVESSEKSSSSESDEFYGFFRQPHFKTPVQTTPSPIETEITQRPVYSSTYIASTLKPVRYNSDEPIGFRYQNDEGHSSTPVQFVGEIRPKYQAASTSEYYEVTQPNIAPEAQELNYQSTPKEIEEPTTKARSRIRIPGRRVTTESSNELHSREESPVRAPQRVRTRGKTHFKLPAKSKDSKESTEDEDVEGGNYPPQFKAGQSHHVTQRPSFQITVDPNFEDQEPYASIFRPTYVAKENNNKEQASWDPGFSIFQSVNDIQNEHKANTEEPEGLPVLSDIDAQYENITNSTTASEGAEIEDEYPTTTPETDETTKKRRGVWKLVKRPMDDFEGAESQHVSNININSFDSDEKGKYEGKSHILEDVDVTTLPPLDEPSISSNSTEEKSFFNSLYEMFGITNKDDIPKDDSVETTTIYKIDETTLQPFEDTTTIKNYDDFYDSNDKEEIPTTLSPNYEDPEVPIHSTQAPMSYITPMSFETWNQGLIHTSTSTEISHETEICYKGKCIKSKDMRVPMT